MRITNGQQSSNPAIKWREIMRHGLDLGPSGYHTPQGADPDECFLKYLEDIYEKRQREIQDFVVQGKPKSYWTGGDQIFYLVGIGLLTYGRLDVVEGIIDNIPSVRNMRGLLGGVRAILPIPKSLDLGANPEAVRQWFHENQAKLQWDEENGVFTLRDT